MYLFWYRERESIVKNTFGTHFCLASQICRLHRTYYNAYGRLPGQNRLANEYEDWTTDPEMERIAKTVSFMAVAKKRHIKLWDHAKSLAPTGVLYRTIEAGHHRMCSKGEARVPWTSSRDDPVSGYWGRRIVLGCEIEIYMGIQ